MYSYISSTTLYVVKPKKGFTVFEVVSYVLDI